MSAVIPVRVPAGTMRPPRATEEPKVLRADHPLAVAGCPVCNGLLADRLVHLVVVGSLDRQPEGDVQSVAAVLVHAECTLPAPVPAAAAAGTLAAPPAARDVRRGDLGVEDPEPRGSAAPCCGPATDGRCETCGAHWHRGHRLRPLNPG